MNTKLNTEQLRKALGVKRKQEIGKIRDNFFIKGRHYVRYSYHIYYFNLNLILEDFSWLEDQHSQNYTLKYIEKYMSPQEIREVFKIKWKNVTRRTKFKGFTFNLFQYVHYFKVNKLYAVYDWDMIRKSKSLPNEIKNKGDKIMSGRKGREFSLKHTAEWDLIRKFVGKKDIVNVFSQDVIDPLDYISEVVSQRIPEKIDKSPAQDIFNSIKFKGEVGNINKNKDTPDKSPTQNGGFMNIHQVNIDGIKYIGSVQLSKLLKVKDKQEFYPIRDKFFIKGLHYIKKIDSRFYLYNLNQILKDFSWFVDRPEKYTLKYIERYLSPREVRKLFDFRGSNINRKIITDDDISFYISKNVHYFKVNETFAVYDWDKICESFPITNELKDKYNKIIKKRKGIREFTLLITAEWDLIRKFVGEKNSSDVFPHYVLDPLSYISKVVSQKIPEKVDRSANKVIFNTSPSVKEVIDGINKITGIWPGEESPFPNSPPEKIVDNIKKEDVVDENPNENKNRNTQPMDFDRRKLEIYLSKLIKDIDNSKEIEFDVEEESEKKMMNFNSQGTKKNILIELTVIT